MKQILFVLSMLALLLGAGCTTQKTIGGEKDEHGCLIAAGYSWCEAKQKCLRPFEEECIKAEDTCNVNEDCIPKPECHPMSCINKKYESNYVKPQICTMEYRQEAAYNPEDCVCANNKCINKNLNQTGQKLIGGDKDEHGCLIAAGYSWCETKQKCLRTWEEECPAEETKMTLVAAKKIAENSECTDKGDLSENYFYNPNSKTWWIDLEMKKEFRKDNCNPACVIYEETGEVEINWRCTGLI